MKSKYKKSKEKGNKINNKVLVIPFFIAND